ncbi:tape measure protein [Leuconostocaceae bacterium ESL0958]|nr:tape measure protein [Leuconostocaceae bacterium ESL0958]
MATLKGTLTLYDNMSKTLNHINGNLQRTVNMMDNLKKSIKGMPSMDNITGPKVNTANTTAQLNNLRSEVAKPIKSGGIDTSAYQGINSINQQATKLQNNLKRTFQGPDVDTSRATEKVYKLQRELSKPMSFAQIKAPEIDTDSATAKLDKFRKFSEQPFTTKTETIDVNVDKGIQRIRLLENALLEAQQKFDAIKLDPKVSADSALAASNKINRLQKELDSAKNSMQNVSPAASSAGKSISEMGDKANSTGSIFKNVLGANVVASTIQKGMGVISSSIGGAVSRFDTLNQYPKVMKQMGYSTEDATGAVNIMKSGIDGLPTSLDDITKSAQSFAILENSASKGAKVATSLSHAFLASGASSADASRGVEQYSQMLAAGKVDMQAWRTLTETMPYALTKVAKSFGITGDAAKEELYEKLANGQITMKQLNERFMELDDGANGWAKTARIASAGIGTSMTNMKIAVTKGVADSIKAIDNGLKKAGTGGIANILDKGRISISDFFKAFNGALESGIPKVIEFVKNMKPVGDVIYQFVRAAGPVGGVMLAGSAGLLAFNKALSGMKVALGAVATHPFISAMFVIGTLLVLAYQHLDWFKKAVDGTFKFLEKHSDIVGRTLPIALFGIVPMAILAISKLKKLKSSFGGLLKKITKSSKAFNDSKNASENAAKGTESLKKGLNGLMKLGGIAVVIASLSLLAVAIQPLAKTGLEGAAAMLAFASAVGIMAFSLGKMGDSLNKGLPGILAFAGSVAVMALAMAPLAKTGLDGAIAMAGFAASVSTIAVVLGLMASKLQGNEAGMLAFGAAVGIMALAMAPLAQTGLDGAIAMAVFGATVAGLAIVLGTMGASLQANMGGILAFAGAISIIALAMAPLANTGTQGAIAMATFGAVVAGLAIVFAIFGPALTAASVGMIAFGAMALMVGAAIMMIGIGINLAMTGLTMFAMTLPIIAAFGMQSALAIMMLGASLLVFGVGAVIAGAALMVLFAGLTLLAAGLFLVGAGALVAGAGFVVLGAGLLSVGVALMVVAAGIMALYNTVVTIFSNIVSAISNAMNNALNVIRNVFNSIGSVFSGAGNLLVNAGKAIIDGLIKGVKGAWEAGKKIFSNITSSIPKLKGPMEYDKVMLVPAGKAIMNGFNKGVTNGFGKVKDNLTRITKTVSKTDVGSISGPTFDNSSYTMPDIQAGMMPVNPGDIMANGFDNALTSLKALLSTMTAADGTSLNVNRNDSNNNNSGFDTKPLMAGGSTTNNKSTDNSQVVHVENGAIQIVTNGTDIDGETIARKLEDFLKHRSDANLANA